MVMCGCSESAVKISENLTHAQVSSNANDLVLSEETATKSKYVIVSNSDGSMDSKFLSEMIDAFADAFYAKTNNVIDKAVYTTKPTKTTEILVGLTGRETQRGYTSVQSNYNKLGKDGFLIQVVGSKIFIIGESLTSQIDALAYFIQNCVGYKFMDGERLSGNNALTVTLPGDYLYIYEGDENQMTLDYTSPSTSPFKVFSCASRDWARLNITPTTDTMFYANYLENKIGSILGTSRSDVVCFSDEATIQKLIDAGKSTNQFYYNPTAICHCDACEAAADKYNCDGAAYFLAMNRVANANKSTFFEILAYQETLDAPENLKMASNIVVYVCDRELCSAHAINDAECPTNRQFASKLEAWNECASYVIMMDFTSDYLYYPATFPNLYTMQKNMNYYATLGLHGVVVAFDERCMADREFADIRVKLYDYLRLDPLMDNETYANIVEYTFHDYYGEEKGAAIFEYMITLTGLVVEQNNCYFTNTRPKDIYSISTENEDGTLTYDMELAQKFYDLWQTAHPYIEGLATNEDIFARKYYSCYETKNEAHAAVQFSKWMFDSVDPTDSYDFSNKLFEKYVSENAE